MTGGRLSFNPGLSGDAELIRCFVVRQVELDLILETLREHAAEPKAANQHLLFLGPAGIGKTMLVRRAAAEVRRDPSLSRHWFPIVFGEEQERIGSPGEFWLRALFHMAEETRSSRWRAIHDELLGEADAQRLRDRALAQLLAFADEQRRRLLLVVENLNTLLAEQFRAGGDWDLRHTFQTEPRIMLLGTATARAGLDEAWQGMFAVRELRPLDEAECATLWRAATGAEAAGESIKAIRVLTGGNPRMLTLLAGHAVTGSFGQLMQQLTALIDSYTPYFKLRLMELPPQERRVFSALLEIWDPAGARQVARRARMGVNAVSALLNRMAGRGEVKIIHQGRRRKLYQAEERLFNTYYLMRQCAHPSARVRAAVDFMTHFYTGPALADRAADLAREALRLSPEERLDHLVAYEELLGRISQDSLRAAIVQATPGAFFELPDVPAGLREAARAIPKRTQLSRLLEKAGRLLSRGQAGPAEEVLLEVTRLEPRQARLWGLLGQLRSRAGRFEEAVQAYGKALEIQPGDAASRGSLLEVLTRQLGRPEAAIAIAEEGVRLMRSEVALRGDPVLPDLAASLNNLGTVLSELGRREEALKCAEEAVEIRRRLAAERPLVFTAPLVVARGNLALLLGALGRREEALRETRLVLEAAPTSAYATGAAIGVLIRIAAAGYAREVLEQLAGSVAAEALEPLAVGLRIYLGESPLVAQEILEVGRDVAERIRKTEANLAMPAIPAISPPASRRTQ